MADIKTNYYREVMEIISEIGVENLTVKTIATKMNVTEAAIYRHFPGKNELLTSAYLAAEHQLWSTFMKEILVNGYFAGTFEEILTTVWCTMFGRLQDDPAFTMFLDRCRASSFDIKVLEDQSFLTSSEFAPICRIFSRNFGEASDREWTRTLDNAMEFCISYICLVLTGGMTRSEASDKLISGFLIDVLRLGSAK